jgi:MYXO-CTERM domain-containing protein
MPASRLRAAAIALALTAASSAAEAATLFVSKRGSDAGNDCRTEATPCASIAHGIAAMAGGDTLVIGDGTYTEPITDMPSGSEEAYTTIRAANDWGVLVDGSGWQDDYQPGIEVSARHHVIVRGIRVRMNQEKTTNVPVQVPYSHHVKIQRCAGSHGPTTDNAATFDVGPTSSYVLLEECYAFGGARYQFLVYQSDHVVVRRSVARHDHWNGTLQCAGFTNYDSVDTAFQNDIVLDSDTAHCSGRLYGGFFNENKDDAAPDTSASYTGNIVLNVQAFYAGHLDWVASGTRTLEDTIIWGSSGGYHGDQGDGLAAVIRGRRMTIGAIGGEYNGPNGSPALGTGFSVYGPVENSLTSSILTRCNSFGVADYTASDYNAFSANGADYGGAHAAAPGAHDRSGGVNGGLLYLPRVEPGSTLKTAGEGGGRVGAEILFKIGRTGTLHGDPGWDEVTAEPLWPFPNEDRIRDDMASYDGPGAAGRRGFAAGNSLDGSPQTLTKYVWEYLGNRIPDDVYGLHVAVGSLPAGVVGEAYSVEVSAGGGTAPYTWSSNGRLPAGLALDASTGVIAGTPSEAGTRAFTIEVTDSQSPPEAASQELSIDIAPAGGDDGEGPSGCGCRATGEGGNGRWFMAALLVFAAGRRRRGRGRPDVRGSPFSPVRVHVERLRTKTAPLACAGLLRATSMYRR